MKDLGLTQQPHRPDCRRPHVRHDARRSSPPIWSPARYIGRCPEQVDDFLKTCVNPVLEQYQELIDQKDVELKV